MTRSREALARRAEKRGLPIPAMVRAESGSAGKDGSGPPGKKAKTVPSEDKTPSKPVTKVIAPIPVVAAVDNRFWMCLKCKNRNLTALSPKCCNRCQRDRSEVETAVSVAEEVVQCDQKRIDPPVLPKTEKAVKKNPKTLEKKEGRAWAVGAPSSEDLQRNRELREAYLDAEKRKDLSVEDLARAELLLARSARKKERKQAMKRPGYRFGRVSGSASSHKPE